MPEKLIAYALGILMFLCIWISEIVFSKNGKDLYHGISSVIIVFGFIAFILNGGIAS